jgi:hypothetical protein
VREKKEEIETKKPCKKAEGGSPRRFSHAADFFFLLCVADGCFFRIIFFFVLSRQLFFFFLYLYTHQ